MSSTNYKLIKNWYNVPMVIQCLTLAACLISPPPQAHESGYLSAYAQTPTDATLAYRQEVGDVPYDVSQYDVLIAVLDCRLIGDEALLYTDVGVLKALVFDCAGVSDGGALWMLENNMIAEIDFYAWQKWPQLVGSHAVLVMGE